MAVVLYRNTTLKFPHRCRPPSLDWPHRDNGHAEIWCRTHRNLGRDWAGSRAAVRFSHAPESCRAYVRNKQDHRLLPMGCECAADSLTINSGFSQPLQVAIAL